MTSRVRAMVVGLRGLLLIPPITVLFGLLGIFRSFFAPTGRATHELVARPWGKAMAWASGVRLKVDGVDNLDAAPGPFIVVFNHSSHLDIPILFATLPLEIRFVAKAELLRIPIFGQAMKRMGNIVIDRKDRAQAVAGLAQAAARMRDLRLSVVIAPEGTRSPDGRLLPFKKGAFALALDSGIPILPVVIEGARAALPKGALAPRGGEVRVRIGRPIPVAGMAHDDRQRLMDAVRRELEPGVPA
jgi:1-acyl-sn-glycerol-3-phosphate acyltransferase